MLERHRTGLKSRGIPDIPFHAGPLLPVHGDYEDMSFSARKLYFQLFFNDVQQTPVTYQTSVYERSQFSDNVALYTRMKRDITDLLFENLDYFQSYDQAKINYDDEQSLVAHALHTAFEYVLAKGAVLYREAELTAFILSQAADMLCTQELTSRKYQTKSQTRTDDKMFGSAQRFKNNYMKGMRRKRLTRREKG